MNVLDRIQLPSGGISSRCDRQLRFVPTTFRDDLGQTSLGPWQAEGKALYFQGTEVAWSSVQTGPLRLCNLQPQ